MKYVVVDLITREELTIPIETKEQAVEISEYLNAQMQDDLYSEVIASY